MERGGVGSGEGCGGQAERVPYAGAGWCQEGHVNRQGRRGITQVVAQEQDTMPSLSLIGPDMRYELAGGGQEGQRHLHSDMQ